MPDILYSLEMLKEKQDPICEQFYNFWINDTAQI
jgi:hypothetical protein